MAVALPPPPRYGLDAPFMVAAVALLATGLVMVASASVAVAEKSTGVPSYLPPRITVFTLTSPFVSAWSLVTSTFSFS